MMKDILLELTKGLGSYNSSVNSSMNAVNKSLMAIGYILVSILFLLELLSWYRFIRNQGGEITWKLFLEVAVKYFIAYFFSFPIRGDSQCHFMVYKWCDQTDWG